MLYEQNNKRESEDQSRADIEEVQDHHEERWREESRGVSGGRGSRERQEREMMYEQCLNDPIPIHHLTQKERVRKAEHKKMGLISKDRQQEIDMMKPKNYAKYKVLETPTIIRTPRLDLITLGLVQKDKTPKYELMVENGLDLITLGFDVINIIIVFVINVAIVVIVIFVIGVIVTIVTACRQQRQR